MSKEQLQQWLKIIKCYPTEYGIEVANEMDFEDLVHNVVSKVDAMEPADLFALGVVAEILAY